jgi:F0F1-type ATP synthase assembly protein I
MQKQKLPVREITVLVLGELLVSLIIVGVYAVLNKFSYAVVAGALLGSAVTVFNFVWLSVSVNRAIDKAMAGRKQGEMSEEEAEAFAAENRVAVQRAAQSSYLLRQILMLGVLVGAFLLDGWFDVIATLVPLLMFRPLLMAAGFFSKKK